MQLQFVSNWEKSAILFIFFVFLYVYIIKVQFVDIQLTLLYGHPV